MLTFGIIDAVLLGVIILEIVAFDPDGIPWLLLGVLIFSTLLYLFMYFLLPKVRYKASGKFAEMKNDYVFHDDEFSATNAGNEYNGSCIIKNSLFQNKLSVYVVDKSTLQDGTADDIRGKLQPILQKNYIVCKY